MKINCKLSLSFMLILFVISCVSPTFESPAVCKGSQSWLGFSTGIRCFDYSIPDEYSRLNSKGFAVSYGFVYGFNNNLGLTSSSSFYSVSSEYWESRHTDYYYSLYLAPKIEFTKISSPVIFSTSIGPSYPELLKTQIMLGFKSKKDEIFALGIHLSFYCPYDVFINIGPAEASGIVIYLGYQIPYFDNPLNLAAGLGYRLRSF
ncbi:MAG: hypothetical protein ACPL28_11995 [bacterium]